jgi:hypothetical protein
MSHETSHMLFLDPWWTNVSASLCIGSQAFPNLLLQWIHLTLHTMKCTSVRFKHSTPTTQKTICMHYKTIWLIIQGYWQLQHVVHIVTTIACNISVTCFKCCLLSGQTPHWPMILVIHCQWTLPNMEDCLASGRYVLNNWTNSFLPLGVASCCASIQLVPYDAVNRNKVSIRQLPFYFPSHYMFWPLRAIFRWDIQLDILKDYVLHLYIKLCTCNGPVVLKIFLKNI